MKGILFALLIVFCFAKEEKVDKCVKGVPIEEVQRVQKRIGELEKRIEQGEILITEVEKKSQEIEKEFKKNLTPKDTNAVHLLKISCDLKRIALFQLNYKLMKMIKEIAEKLPKDMATEIIKKLDIEGRMKRNDNIINTLKILFKEDGNKMMKFRKNIFRKRWDTTKLVTQLAFESVNEQSLRKAAVKETLAMLKKRK